MYVYLYRSPEFSPLRRSTQAFLSVGGLVPLNLVYCQSNLEQPEGEFNHVDWAGVEGMWNCSFCYIDHRDLLGAQVSNKLCTLELTISTKLSTPKR